MALVVPTRARSPQSKQSAYGPDGFPPKPHQLPRLEQLRCSGPVIQVYLH